MLNSPFFDTTARLRHGTACRSRQTEEIYLRSHYIQIYVTRQWTIVPICSERSCAYIPNLRCQISIFYRIMSRRNTLRHMRNAHRRLPSRYENRKKTPQGGRFQTQGTARTVKNAPAFPCGCGRFTRPVRLVRFGMFSSQTERNAAERTAVSSIAVHLQRPIYGHMGNAAHNARLHADRAGGRGRILDNLHIVSALLGSRQDRAVAASTSRRSIS